MMAFLNQELINLIKLPCQNPHLIHLMTHAKRRSNPESFFHAIGKFVFGNCKAIHCKINKKQNKQKIEILIPIFPKY